MDIKSKIEIKDEPFQEAEYDGTNEFALEQISELQEIPYETCDLSINFKKENEIKEKSFYIRMEDAENNKFVDKMPGTHEKQYCNTEENNILERRKSSGNGDLGLKVEDNTEDEDLEQFICLNCNVNFESEEELTGHLESLCDGKVECFSTSYESMGESDLEICSSTRKSKDIINSKPKLFKCSECNYEFRFKRSLRIHLLKHKKPELFKCSECSYECHLDTNLTKHLLTHTLFKCSECDYECSLKTNLERHAVTHLKLFKCSECSSEFNRKESLKRHLFMHQKEKLKCSQCNYKYKFKEDIKRHLITHSKQLFNCYVCGYDCFKKNTFIQHMITHKRCFECDYKCNDKDLLEMHVLTHQNGKLFKCSDCSYISGYEGRLATHMLIHQKKTNLKKDTLQIRNIKLFNCTECPDESNHDDDDNDVKILTPANSFKCSVCYYECNEERKLKLHSEKHRKDTLKKHLLLYKKKGQERL